MEYHVINQVVSGLEVESRALIEDIVRANRQTTLIIGSNHCGKSYLLTQLFNFDRSRIKMFQCGGPHNTEHIIFDSFLNELKQLLRLSNQTEHISFFFDEITNEKLLREIMTLCNSRNISFYITAFNVPTTPFFHTPDVYAVDIFKRYSCCINSILNEGNYSEVRRLVAGDWFTLHAQVGKGVDYPDAIQQVNLQHRAQIAEKKLAKTKTIITSPYYNSLKVLDFYQK